MWASRKLYIHNGRNGARADVGVRRYIRNGRGAIFATGNAIFAMVKAILSTGKRVRKGGKWDGWGGEVAPSNKGAGVAFKCTIFRY